ncbi:NMCC_0638 family (lipo)protein [Pelagibius sp.]|uniref:NMCC_0638 family (lipo)protein n=1 Tax=Pelagibius sp. TaxID=1931238 RepID=UPI003BAE1EE8
MSTILRRFGALAAVLALPLLLAAPAARAADPAREVVGLFVQSCLKYVEDPLDLRAWIDSVPQLRKLSQSQSQAFLSGKGGDVWSASNDAGLFALVVFNDDTCSVMAQFANATEVSQVFSEYLRRKQLPIDKVGDQTKYTRGIDQREETYRSSDGSILYEVVVLTSQSPRAEVQAVLTTRPNR